MQVWQYCVYEQLQVSSTCFGRPLRPSSGALYSVTAATGVCHELGWNKSYIDVPRVGAHYSAHRPANIYTGFIPSQLMTNTSGCCYNL